MERHCAVCRRTLSPAEVVHRPHADVALLLDDLAEAAVPGWVAFCAACDAEAERRLAGAERRAGGLGDASR